VGVLVRDLIILISGMLCGSVVGLLFMTLVVGYKETNRSRKSNKPPVNWAGEIPVSLEDSDNFNGFM
jgi:hypothetical protein